MQTDWTVTERDGVCLVRVLVDNPAPVARRVSVSNRLDGPVLPPRREGVPERGWTDDGFEGTVPAERRLALGYACPAPAARPPVAVESKGRADPDEDSTDETPVAVVRRLGTHAPPADAVPTRTRPDGAFEGGAPDDATGDSPLNDLDDRDDPDNSNNPDDPGGPAADVSDLRCADRPSANGRSADPSVTSDTSGATPLGDDAVPGDATAWFAAVEARVDRADHLDGASVTAATVAVREAGGMDPLTALPDHLSADAAALRAVARRADRLADRAEAAAADVPVDALRRLA